MEIDKVMWAPDGQSEGGEATNTPPAGVSTRTFTQEQLDAIVGERAMRAKGAAIGELLSELGFEKADDLRALVKAAKERQASEQTEAQKLQAQLADAQKRSQTLETKLREQALQIAVQAAAQKVGIVDAEVALALVRDGIEFDANGMPQGVEAAVTELARQKPYLRVGASGGSNPTNPARGGQTLTREAIAKMTPEQINENWEAVQAALAK
jgi:hypothetical protein